MNPTARTREYVSYARPMSNAPRVKHCAASPDEVPTREKIARPVGTKPKNGSWQ